MAHIGLENQLGVALLATLGALALRRFSLPRQLHAIVPLCVATIIVWAFGGPGDSLAILTNGAVSGLLASGFLYIMMGLKSR